MPINRRCLTILATFAAAVSIPHVVRAGPPLICEPFVAPAQPLLPWNDASRNWHAPDRAYDIEKLVADTLRLLDADAPMFARMENLRRATIYAAENPRVANELLDAVLERLQRSHADVAVEAIVWFDAGYLLESYRQHSMIDDVDMIASYRLAHGRALPTELDALDGYALVQRAIALASESRADMEFAASLMTRDAVVAAAHRKRAEQGAFEGSLLAANLAR